MSLSIRPGIYDDAANAAEIALLAWESIHEEYLRQIGDALHSIFYNDWKRNKAESVISSFEPQKGEGAYVVEEDGQLIGFITYTMDFGSKIGTIQNNAVIPGCQGRGIGTMMYDKALSHFRENGMRAATVSTGGDPAHARARKAYEKAGFNLSLPSVTYFQKLD